MKLLRPTCMALFLAILASSVLPLASRGALAQTNGWEFLAPGIDYQWFRLPDPNNVYVSRMDRSNPNVTLEGTLANNYLYNGRTRVRDMFGAYEGTLGFWGKQWGTRMDAVVGINGFFTVSDSDPTLASGQVQSGWYIKHFDTCETTAGFVWNQSREAFIAGGVYHVGKKQNIVFLENTDIQPKNIHGVNRARSNDEIVMYTTHYGASTRTDENGIELVIEIERPVGTLPTVQGVIRQVRNHAGNTPIQFDQVIISGVGEAKVDMLRSRAVVGQRVAISQEVTYCGFVEDPALKRDWTNAYTSIGVANNIVVKEGQVPAGLARNDIQPMTAIGFNDQYIYFIVIDGRNSKAGVSRGMSSYEIGVFAKNYLDATYAVTLDGGGSSTMVVNGEVKNDTNCNFTNCDNPSSSMVPNEMGLLMETIDPTIEGGSQTMGIWSEDVQKYEAIVPNGLLMTVVEPPVRFNAFPAGSTPKVFTNTEFRLGPGRNYDRVAGVPEIPEGETVEVVENSNNMNGIFVHGFHWWKVSYGGQEGWAPLDVTQADLPNQVYLPVIR